MRRPNQPQLTSSPAVKTTLAETSVHPLCQKTIEEDLRDENTVYYRMFGITGLTVLLLVGLYFLMNPELWQTVITSIIVSIIIITINVIAVFQFLYNRRIVQNADDKPYLTVSENTINIADEEIQANSIYSIIHSDLKSVNPLNQSGIIRNGGQILVFAKNKSDKMKPYPVSKIDTSHTSVYRLSLNDFEMPEQLLLAVVKFSEINNIPCTMNEASIKKIANETINIHKSLQQKEQRVNFSSIEQCDF